MEQRYDSSVLDVSGDLEGHHMSGGMLEQDMEQLCVLGEGGFGTVALVLVDTHDPTVGRKLAARKSYLLDRASGDQGATASRPCASGRVRMRNRHTHTDRNAMPHEGDGCL